MIFESNDEFKQFINAYVKAMNDENEPDKPKIINFLRFRLLDRENGSMKKVTDEGEKMKVEGMDADQFAEYLDQKKAEVVQYKVVDFINKGGKQFNEMYIDEHIRRGLKGVLKPNYMRDLANQLGVDVMILNAFDKKDEGFNKIVNSQMASIREGIKQKQEEKKQVEKKEKEKQEKKQKQKQKAQEYLMTLEQAQAEGKPALEGEESEEEEPLKINKPPVTPKKAELNTPGSGLEVFGTPMTTSQQKSFLEQLEKKVAESGDKLTDREKTSLDLLKKKDSTKKNLTPKERMKVDFLVKSLSPVKGELPKYNTRMQDQKTKFRLYEAAHTAIKNWEKEKTNIKNQTFVNKLSKKLSVSEEEAKKLDQTYGLYKAFQTKQKEKK